MGSILQDERDDGKNDEDDDEPLGDIHTEPGDTPSAENGSDECKYQKQDRKFDEISSEL